MASKRGAGPLVADSTGRLRRARRTAASNANRKERVAEATSTTIRGRHHAEKNDVNGRWWINLCRMQGLDAWASEFACDHLGARKVVLTTRRCSVSLFFGRMEDNPDCSPAQCEAAIAALRDAMHDAAFHARSVCPRCGVDMAEHQLWELYVNQLRPGDYIDWHKDEPPPHAAGFAGDCTMVVLLQAAQVGGQLQVSSRSDGTIGQVQGARGSRIARNSDTLPLWERLDAIVMDGSAADHRVSKVVSGTRVSLVAGFRCPCRP